MIFINFKTYRKGTGADAISLVRIIQAVADEYYIKIIPVVQASDIKEIAGSSKLEVWTQKIDPFEFGAHTGAVIPEAVYEDGAMGTFLNHSEAKFQDFKLLKTSVQRAHEVGLKTLVFASDIKEFEKVLKLNPTYISYEPPEFIGSKDTSVAKEKPEMISKAVEISKRKGVPLIVGAGIKSADDIRTSLKLGAVGVAVASDIVASEYPKRELVDLVEGFGGEV